MNSWREVVVEARARGFFTAAEHQRWQNMLTCPAAEQVMAYGVLPQKPRRGVINAVMNHSPWSALWDLGDYIGPAIMRNDFDAVEGVLDKLEELALGLKREGL